MAGRNDEARHLMQQLSDRAEHGYVAPSFFAWISSGLGETDEAFRWLDLGFSGRDPLMAWLFLPTLDRVRSDKRFDDLLRKMKLC